MPRPLYPEHQVLQLEDTVWVCRRCKWGLVYRPPGVGPVCHRCGNTGDDGEAYVRAARVCELVGAVAPGGSTLSAWETLRRAEPRRARGRRSGR